MESTILVTGGAGYVGSRLIRDLAEGGGEVTIRLLDNMQTRRYGSLADLPPSGRYEFHEGDIMDPVAVRRALEGVDTVIHLAALVRTPFSSDHPTWTEHVNHWGTARLVEDCVQAGVFRFIFASSASVYGPGRGFREEDPCSPIGAYSQSKLHAEEVVRGATPRGLVPTILRLAMVYGDAPAVRFDAVPNRFAYLAAIGRTIPLHGTGDQVRPIVHISDASSAIIHVVGDDRHMGKTYNVVGENLSIREMAEAVRSVRPFSEVRETAQHELARLSLSIRGDRLTATGWAPQGGIEQGIEEIFDRYGRFAQPGVQAFEDEV